MGVGLEGHVAFRTHSAVVFFIENLALGYDLRQKRFSFFQSPFHASWRSNDEVHREGSRDCETNLERLVELVASRHYDQDIHVTVFVRCTVGMGAKKDN